MSGALRFCLVTSTHIASNPRLVKEADALSQAGYRVRVVALNRDVESSRLDATVLARRAGRRGWTLHRIAAGRWRGGGLGRWMRDALLERAARLLLRAGLSHARLAERALSRHVGALASAAASEPADVVVAHNLAALPAAARAARRLGARLAFDIEDLHTGELPPEARWDAERRLRARVERRLLARCDLLTAASDGIADEIVALYGVPRPTVVLNVFPVADRAAAPPPRAARPSLYWYSQVVGPDRGLDDALRALARLPFAVDLYLRGAMLRAYEPALRALAAELGIADRVHLLPPAPPDELVALAQRHDIGLALEQPISRNREICVTNKLFTYLLAGLAVAATDTIGQRGILAARPDVGFLYRAGDVDGLAAGLTRLLGDPDALARARAAAWRAAEERYCWEVERERLLAHLTHGIRGESAARSEPAAV